MVWLPLAAAIMLCTAPSPVPVCLSVLLMLKEGSECVQLITGSEICSVNFWQDLQTDHEFH